VGGGGVDAIGIGYGGGDRDGCGYQVGDDEGGEAVNKNQCLMNEIHQQTLEILVETIETVDIVDIIVI